MAGMGAERMGYRAELDGLRGVAILLVLGLHWWPSVFPGGGAGVDVFFVLSGFLITRLLIEERKNSGTVSLRSFWVRRFRRLMPAYLVLLTAFWWVDGAWWSVIYLGNWGVIAGDVGEPLRHTWSLAIEEQFYVVWPIAFVVLARLRRRATIGILLLGVALMSVAHANSSGLDAVFGTFTRPAGMLIGCALAFGWPFGSWGRPVALAWPAAAGILAAVVVVGDRPGAWELTQVASAVLLVAVVELRPRPPVWLVGVGLLSYSLYLWHYPITVLLRGGEVRAGSPWATVLAIPLSLVAASGSYWIERKFRSKRVPEHHEPATAGAATAATATA